MGGGLRDEAPKAPRGVGCGEGVSPSPLRVGSGEGALRLTFVMYSIGEGGIPRLGVTPGVRNLYH